MKDIIAAADINVAVERSEIEGELPPLFMPADTNAFQAVKGVAETSKYYASLTDEDLEDFVSRGLIVHPKKPGYLTCAHHTREGRHLEFQSAARLQQHFRNVGFHKSVTVVPEPLQEPPELDIPLERLFERLGVWADVEVLVANVPESLDLELRSLPLELQRWCCSLVDAYRAVQLRRPQWFDTLFTAIPKPLKHFCEIEVGRCKCSLESLLVAIAGVPPVPWAEAEETSSISVVGPNGPPEKMRVGSAMGLVSQGLRAMVAQILKLEDTVAPRGDREFFVFAVVGLMNKHAEDNKGAFRILPIYGQQQQQPNAQRRLVNIKVEPMCGDVRKVAKPTHAQQASGRLESRMRRADSSQFPAIGSGHSSRPGP